jgi:hypothetical protein
LWSVQWSLYPGHGRLMTARDPNLKAVLWALAKAEEVRLHHAAADRDPIERAGFTIERWRDTMQEAFRTHKLPQGLKPLVYRLFGVMMTSYEDVVWPHSIRQVREWLLEALYVAKLDLCAIEVRKARGKGKTREIRKPGPAEQLFSRLLAHADEHADYDPWRNGKVSKQDKAPRLEEFWADETSQWMVNHLEARVGRFPTLGIANAPMAEAIEYGCSDADWTGQVANRLEQMRPGLFQISDGDRDDH